MMSELGMMGWKEMVCCVISGCATLHNGVGSPSWIKLGMQADRHRSLEMDLKAESCCPGYTYNQKAEVRQPGPFPMIRIVPIHQNLSE